MSDNETEERLRRLRAGRGYALPHHGLMARLAPDLFDLFDAFYLRINTVDPDQDSRRYREFLWLVILLSVRSGTASHHATKFAEAAGSAAEVALAIRIASLPQQAGSVEFAVTHWADRIEGLSAPDLWASMHPAPEGTDRLERRQIDLACALAFGCRRHATGFRRHLAATLHAGMAERDVFDALCLMILPAGLPAFVRCAGIWRTLIDEGEVLASDGLARWAEEADAETDLPKMSDP